MLRRRDLQNPDKAHQDGCAEGAAVGLLRVCYLCSIQA